MGARRMEGGPDLPPPAITVGLDPDTKCLGWAVKTERGPVRCGTVMLAEHGKMAVVKALAEIEKITRQIGGEVQTVVVEAPFVGKNAKTAMQLSEAMARAALAAEMTWPHAEIVRMLPLQWRQGAGISTGATKLEVAFHARALGWDPPDQHAADAALMAEAA